MRLEIKSISLSLKVEPSISKVSFSFSTSKFWSLSPLEDSLNEMVRKDAMNRVMDKDKKKSAKWKTGSGTTNREGRENGQHTKDKS